ncbi:mobile element protein (plasmid) [Escherichia coli]|nr:mobile element protein [Escherichia coli]
MPAFTDNFPRYQSYVLKAPLYPKPRGKNVPGGPTSLMSLKSP